MNPLFNVLSGGGGGYMQVLMQAVGAAMRGESPEAFMQKLAQTNPQLRGMDMSNLEGTARSLAQQKGADINQVAESVKNSINKFI